MTVIQKVYTFRAWTRFIKHHSAHLSGNIEKHGLDFVDVVLVFQDSYARIEYDPKHSEGEERYRITGSIKGIIVVVVIFTDRNNVTRIISARRATRQEVKDYERRF